MSSIEEKKPSIIVFPLTSNFYLSQIILYVF